MMVTVAPRLPDAGVSLEIAGFAVGDGVGDGEGDGAGASSR